MIGPDVIVTGRRGTTIQGELERSYSASHLDAITLARRPPQSLAELLSGLPGLWVDTSAGAAANTIRVRGIPSTDIRGSRFRWTACRSSTTPCPGPISTSSSAPT
ncbi:Plug domain-containing protein [Sphingomonas sp. I4]